MPYKTRARQSCASWNKRLARDRATSRMPVNMGHGPLLGLSYTMYPNGSYLLNSFTDLHRLLRGNPPFLHLSPHGAFTRRFLFVALRSRRGARPFLLTHQNTRAQPPLYTRALAPPTRRRSSVHYSQRLGIPRFHSTYQTHCVSRPRGRYAGCGVADTPRAPTSTNGVLNSTLSPLLQAFDRWDSSKPGHSVATYRCCVLRRYRTFICILYWTLRRGAPRLAAFLYRRDTSCRPSTPVSRKPPRLLHHLSFVYA